MESVPSEAQMSSIRSLVPRDRYAALERCTYLNQASLGLIPAPAIEAMETFLEGDGAVREPLSQRRPGGCDPG